MEISVVIPIYNCENCLAELYFRLNKSLQSLHQSYEIIFVNDGSKDYSWRKIRQLTQTDTHIVAINLRHNFGQHSAIAVGLGFASGKWNIVMDGDLQDSPESIPLLYKQSRLRWEAIFAKRRFRRFNKIYLFFDQLYHALLFIVTGKQSDISVGNFSIINRTLRNRLLKFPYLKNSYLQSVRRLAKRVAYIEVLHDRRFAGESSYTFLKLVNLAFASIICWISPIKLTKAQNFSPMIADTIGRAP